MACATIMLTLTATYLAPDTVGDGYEMDEGAVVAYGERVLDGAVPHRDFLTFYGPGGPWLIAGAFEVFGASVGTERAVAVGYRVLIALSLFLIGYLLAGLGGGALATLVAAVSMGHELVWAYASYGALAFGLLGIALTGWGASAASWRSQSVLMVGGGLAGALAILVRFDFALAIVLGAVALLPVIPRRGRAAYGGGVLVGVAVYAVHAVVVGPERIARLAGDLMASGPGRKLPIPDLVTYPGSLLASGVLISVLFAGIGLVRRRRDRGDASAHMLLSVGVFSLALLPLTLSRADAIHIRPLAIAPLSLLPALALMLSRDVLTVRISQRLAVAFVALVTVMAVWSVEDVGIGRVRDANAARSADRGFFRDDNPAAREVVQRARELSRAGELLFVGPQDLRRTNYGPTYMYFLLRELEPASYYMEMNPGTANREGSGLADDIRGADWLILTSEWDSWNEPNESREFGPSEPNEVVRDDFCLRFERDQYRLYERCDRLR